MDAPKSRSAEAGALRRGLGAALGLLLAIVLVAGCAEQSGSSGKQCAESNAVFNDFNVFAIDLDQMTEPAPGGVCVQDLTEGAGRLAQIEDDVIVDLQGWTADGTAFDSAIGLNLELGAGQVIPGVERGILEMKVGGLRTLVIAPELAYGEAGTNGVPPNSVVVYRISVNSISRP